MTKRMDRPTYRDAWTHLKIGRQDARQKNGEMRRETKKIGTQDARPKKWGDKKRDKKNREMRCKTKKNRKMRP